jgi:hypothetical protein
MERRRDDISASTTFADMVLAMQKAHEFVRMSPRAVRGQQKEENDREGDPSVAPESQEIGTNNVEGEEQPGFAERVQEGRRGRKR